MATETAGGSAAAATQQAPETKKTPAAAGCLGCLGIVFLLGVASAFCPSSKTASQGEDPIAAYVMCEQFVKERLKAPATAEFGGYVNSTVTPKGTGHFAVSGYVDAQNSFGAKLRSRFACDISYAGNDRWRANNVTVQ
jgi:hypothetical protein